MREILIVTLLVVAFSASGMDVKVNLFTGKTFSDVKFTHNQGKFNLYGDDEEIASLTKGESLNIKKSDNSISVYKGDILLGNYQSVQILEKGFVNSVKIEAQGQKAYYYEGDFHLSLENQTLTITNVVDLEKYVAGVVQAESGGSTNSVEYFMVQAIISRTYALRIINKNDSSFILADDVSMQVYHGKASKKEVLIAVSRTIGEVVVDQDSNLIDAVFHSNSGGVTMNSEDVWLTSVPYLRSVTDTFSFNMRNSEWTKEMPMQQWLNYLSATHGYPVHVDSMKNAAISYIPDERNKYFHDSIPLTKIRYDLKLKSTYFAITYNEDKVIFTGKGFGHGVGLSQEGAIRMAENGYEAHDIIKHYYTGVDVYSTENIPLLAYFK